MPAEFKLTETRQPPLKDQYDEWLARVICYAFSVPASAFVTQVNRATSETLRTQAAQEGLVPLKAWVKMMFDRVIGEYFREPDLEFYWVGDDAVDPLQQAQTIAILVNAGVKTRDEARADLGLGRGAGVTKFNPYHDERGRFTDAGHAVEPGAESSSTNASNEQRDPVKDDPRVSDAAYQRLFHDQVVRGELEWYRKAGATCLSETRLTFGGVTARLDILCRTQASMILGVEVKTGDDPKFTEGQLFVYDHTLTGSVTSPDSKVSMWGLAPNAPLPPFPVLLMLTAGPGYPKRYFAPKNYPVYGHTSQ
jgi:hypothetical protein